jgi:carbamoylphosphate synthase small subunit
MQPVEKSPLAEITHINLNEYNRRLKVKGKAFSVQYHPEADLATRF